MKAIEMDLILFVPIIYLDVLLYVYYTFIYEALTQCIILYIIYQAAARASHLSVRYYYKEIKILNDDAESEMFLLKNSLIHFIGNILDIFGVEVNEVF
jgi:hypothetical protein